MNTRSDTFVPLIHCVIDDTLSQAIPDLRQTLLQFIDAMNLMSVHGKCFRASIHAKGGHFSI